MNLEKGQRVTTAHGAGTIAGFESFDEDGHNAEPSETDNGNRAIVRLDNPDNWPAHTIATTDPHYQRDELSLI